MSGRPGGLSDEQKSFKYVIFPRFNTNVRGSSFSNFVSIGFEI